MSEFLGEASVLIRPDTTKFRAELTAQLALATRGLAVTVPVVSAAPQALREVAVASQAASTSLNQNAVAAQAAGAAHAKAATQVRSHAVSMGQLEKGAAATGLSLFGVRGATLAASGSFLAGAAAVTLFAKAVGLAANLEEELNVFRVTAGATADEMDRVAEAARRLGADVSLPAVSAGDAAQALTLLSKAGLDVEASLAAAQGVLQLATAAQIENAEAVRLVATALNSFELAGTEAVRVADLLTGASLESQAEISDMGLALQQAAAAASLVGLELDDTVALLTLLTKAGLRGSDAGTSLRTAIIKLVSPTDKAKAQIEGLNIQLRDLEGNLRPEIFSDFIAATEKLGRARQQELAGDIFGQDAFRAVTLIGRQGADGLDEVTVAINEAGLAADVAGARMAGFTGDMEALKNSLETLGGSVGSILIPALSETVQSINKVATAANLAGESIREFGDVSVPVLGRVGDRFRGIASFVGGGGLIPVVGQVKAVTTAMEALGIGSEEASEGMGEAVITLGELFRTLLPLSEEINKVSRAFAGLSPKQILGRQAGLEEREVVARIGGSTDAILEALRARQEELEKQLGTQTVQRRPALRRQLEGQLLGTLQEIESIEQGLAADAKRQADEVQRARDERQRALLATFDLRVSQQQNRLVAASFTATLQDDLKAQQRLRGILQGIINSGKLGAADLAKFARDLINTAGEIKRINQEIKAARQAERRERLDRIQEELGLDLQIAQATGNEGAQRRALNAEIKFFQERIRATRKGSIERKRWLLELRRAQAELRELKDEAEGTGNAFRELAFEFLQTQQGFAANLLGNLLPGSATAGTVGGESGPGGTGGELAVGARGVGAGLGREAQISEARGAGATRGQAAGTNEILRQILRVLKDVHRGAGHPEARYTQVRAGSAMDVM